MKFGATILAVATLAGSALAQSPPQPSQPPPQPEPPRSLRDRFRPPPGLPQGPILPFNPGFDDAGRDRGPRAEGRFFTYLGQPRPRIRTTPYRWPRGYYYAGRPAGTVLPPALILRNYRLDAQTRRRFGLPDPGPGELWLRVGDDALRVQEATGLILESAPQAYY